MSNNSNSIKYNLETEELNLIIVYADSTEQYLKKLKERVPESIYKNKTEIQRIISVTNYVNSILEHDGWVVYSKNDPISILNKAEVGGKFRCVEFSILTAGILNSLGIPTRVVGLKTKDVETRSSDAGHVVVEAYLVTRKNWQMIDPQCNEIPRKNGKSLSIYEFQQELYENGEKVDIGPKYMSWIKPYLFYFDVKVDQRTNYYQAVSNFMKKAEKRIMLVPIGAENPKLFQQKFKIKNTTYINSVKDFYIDPVIK